MKKAIILNILLYFFTLSLCYSADKKKLYWFIPDGMRSEPYLFNIYKWAEEGYLPNIKKLMEKGSYGFCKPVFPGHTPTNFATLFTGTYPERHGVADGPMHTENNPLDKPSIVGFRSTAKKIDPIWRYLENAGYKVALLSIPGSTPPQLLSGYTINGRWGGWGSDFCAVNYEESSEGIMRYKSGRHSRLFFFGPSLTRFHKAEVIKETIVPQTSFSPIKSFNCDAWGANIRGFIYDSSDDAAVNYDKIVFTDPDGNIIADIPAGEWSEWKPVSLRWKKMAIESYVRIKIIKLDPDGFYRVRILYNNLNSTNVRPELLSLDLLQNAGPMVDFVDNFPPQLIFYPEDKNTFMEESGFSFDWHKKAASYLLSDKDLDVFIHDIYTSNQMLTSRWWMGYIDPASTNYDKKTEQERQQLWNEVKDMYKNLDDIIGIYLEKADKDTFVILSSDHGAAPLNRWVHLNNLFAKHGWLHYTIDAVSGEPVIDWQHSQVIYLKMDSVYVNPEGLHDSSGRWHRADSKEYRKLRKKVIKLLSKLRDSNGIQPVERISTWEDAENKFRLPPERVGDIVIANKPGYGWNEEMTAEGNIFSEPLKTGYKQAIISDNYPAMWAPFIISGPGIKKNNFLGDKPINMIDQFPTIMKAMGQDIPDNVQGSVVDRVFE